MRDRKPFRPSAAAISLLSATGLSLAASVACSSSEDSSSPNATPSDLSADGAGAENLAPSDDAGASLGAPRVYVGSGDGKIRLYSFDTTTYALTLIDTVDSGKAPSFLAFDPDRHFAYAVADQQEQLRSFSVAPSTGKLTSLQTIDSKGSGPTYIGLDRAGQLAMVANYGGGTIALFPRLADGRLGESSATRSFGDSAQTHEIVIDPTNTFVYVPNKGLDRVSIFRRDGDTLTDVGSVASGDGPRHMDFDRLGPHVYVIDENGSTVSAFTSNASTGALTPLQTVSSLPAGYDGGTNTGAEIQVLPDSRHLIVSNRGDNSLVVFDIDASSGKLTWRARVPTGGATPRHFQVESTGRFLFVGNEGSGSVVVMTVDQATGVPTPVGSPLAVPSPSYVGLVYLPTP